MFLEQSFTEKGTTDGNEGRILIGTHPKLTQVFQDANKLAVSQHWTLHNDPPEKQPQSSRSME